jgi:hypothetical protein
MAKFGWQAHTTRALMSAGGSVTKKHGITVISEKVSDAHTRDQVRRPSPAGRSPNSVGLKICWVLLLYPKVG